MEPGELVVHPRVRELLGPYSEGVFLRDHALDAELEIYRFTHTATHKRLCGDGLLTGIAGDINGEDAQVMIDMTMYPGITCSDFLGNYLELFEMPRIMYVAREAEITYNARACAALSLASPLSDLIQHALRDPDAVIDEDGPVLDTIQEYPDAPTHAFFRTRYHHLEYFPGEWSTDEKPRLTIYTGRIHPQFLDRMLERFPEMVLPRPTRKKLIREATRMLAGQMLLR